MLKVKAAFPNGEAADLIGTLADALPFTPHEHERAERGLSSESRFSDVFSALDWVALVHGLEQWQLPLASKSEWQVPDYLIVVRTPDREPTPVLAETKLVSGEKVTFEISLTNLDLLKRYASLVGMPLIIAVFWEKLHLWTTHTPDQLTLTSKVARISFDDAMRNDVSVIFSDTLFVISVDWRRRTTYDPDPKNFHLHDPDRGFIVEDHLAVDGSNFVQLTEVESGIVNRIMRSKVLNVEKNGRQRTVTTASLRDSVAKASSIVHLLLQDFEAFGEEDAPERSLNTLVRLKLNTKMSIQPHLPLKNTPQVKDLFERAFGFPLPDE